MKELPNAPDKAPIYQWWQNGRDLPAVGALSALIILLVVLVVW